MNSSLISPVNSQHSSMIAHSRVKGKTPHNNKPIIQVSKIVK